MDRHIDQKKREIEQLYNKIGQATFKALQDNALSDIEAAIKDFSQEIVQKQQESAELERNITEIRSADAKAPEAQSPEPKSADTKAPEAKSPKVQKPKATKTRTSKPASTG